MHIKEAKAGFTDDEYQGIIINDDRLLDGQDFHKKYKDLSMVFIVGFILNILDANIDAHLLDFNVNEDLSFKPYFENDELFNPNIGLKKLKLAYKMNVTIIGYGKMGKEIENVLISKRS